MRLYSMTVLPLSVRYCLGRAVPIRLPTPAAGITAQLHARAASSVIAIDSIYDSLRNIAFGVRFIHLIINVYYIPYASSNSKFGIGYRYRRKGANLSDI